MDDRLHAWPAALELEGDDGTPVFLRIARAVSQAIADGRLAPGSALPGSRPLAASLGVHRNTVLAALAELRAEGWITASEARGTYVSTELPERRPRRWAHAAGPVEARARACAFDLAGRAPTAAGARRVAEAYRAVAAAPYPLVGGVPDRRALPSAALARAYRRALRQAAPLGYGDPRGEPRLREALAAMLARVRGLAASADDVLVTRGSQMALDLAARALVAPGDAVAVEAWGYRPAWEALKLAGARLVPVPTDAHGLDVDALEALLRAERIRAVYVTPHHQYPTTALLAPGRRLRLLDLAARYRFAVLEDDYDHEFHYDGRPVLPLAAADRHGSVVYLGTLSKILAPGLRLGFLVAPPPLVARAAELRFFADRQGDHAMERAIAELVEDGELQRHVRRMRAVYMGRRGALVAALEKHLEGALDYAVPAGGLALWARARGLSGEAVERWAERALASGVIVHDARRFTFDGRARPFLRVGFAPLGEKAIEEGVRRLARARR
jgi:GntR family transcriptional regulator/MocR family aminotransferase